MQTNNDHSHATNVANFEALIAYCSTLGSRYNPSQDKLKITYMQSRLTQAQTIMSALDSAMRDDIEARNRRRNLFDGLPALAARIVTMYSFCDVSNDDLESVKSLLKKMQGRRLSATTENAEEHPAEAATEETEQHEASQRSYMFMVQHFSSMVEAVSRAADYNPNEIELKIAALESYLEKLKDANTETGNTGAALDTARVNRDRALYRDGDGLVKIAKNVKKYVTVVYGTESPQSDHVHSIIFIDRNFKELEQVFPDPA